MASMNKLVKVTEIQATMQQMSEEMMKVCADPTMVCMLMRRRFVAIARRHDGRGSAESVDSTCLRRLV